MARRKAAKRDADAPMPSVEENFAKVWQLTLEEYTARGITVGPMRRDIVRTIRGKRRRAR